MEGTITDNVETAYVVWQHSAPNHDTFRKTNDELKRLFSNPYTVMGNKCERLGGWDTFGKWKTAGYRRC